MRKLYIAILTIFLVSISISRLAAQVNTYVFSPGTGGILEDMSTGTTQLIGSGSDDGVSTVTNIGFSFTFNGVAYTQFSVNANGLLRLGSTVITDTWLNNDPDDGFLSTTNMPEVAAYFDDLATGSNGKVHYKLVGTAPNQKLVVEWKVTVPRATTGSAGATFQAWFEQTSNRVTIVYGAGMAENSLNAGYSIGIASSPTDFQSVTSASNTSSTSAHNGDQTEPITSGTTYEFFPPPPCVPGSLAGGTAASDIAIACPGNPINLSVTGASFGSGLTFQWESSPDNSTWTPIAGQTSMAATVSQLTNRYYRRKMTCSGSDAFSSSVQVTNSPLQTLPFTEDFIAYDTDIPPGCWTTSNIDFMFGSAASAYGIGDGSILYDFYDASAGTVIDLTTPTFAAAGVNHRVTFDYAYATFFDEVDQLEVLYSTDGGATYTSLIVYLGGTDGILNTGGTSFGGFFPSESQWKSMALDIPAGTNKLLFRGTSAFGNALYLDNITIEPTPPCLPPTGLSITGLTPTTASLAWLASTTAPSNGYRWEVRLTGAGGSGPTGLAASGTTAAGVLTAVATGLTSSTTYSLYVRSDCGLGVLSAWSLPIKLTTLCDPTNIPFVQNFDDASSPDFPNCVRVQDVNGATGWIMYYDGGTPASTQPNSIYYAWNATTPADDWFFLQGLNLTGGKTYYLRFKYKASDGPFFVENLEVKYGTAPFAANMTSGTLFSEIGISSALDDPFAEATVPFTPTVSGVYYLGFHAFSDADQAFLLVDDVMVEACPSPSDVTSISPLPGSIVVNFTSAQTNFIVEYGAPGFVPGLGAAAGAGTIVTGTSSPINITTGLTPGTPYDIYIRTNCGGGDFSLNIKTTTITQCTPTSLPYTMDFDATSVPDMPSCTSIQDLNGNPTWQTFTAPAAWGFPGNSLRYLYNPTKEADDWFFIQALNLTAGTSYQLTYKYGPTDKLYPEKMEVKYGTTATAASMTTLIMDHPNIVANNAAPFAKVQRVTFTVPANGAYYIGFHVYSDADEFQFFLDSINVKVQPLVDVAIVGLQNAPTCPVTNNSLHAYLVNNNLGDIDFAADPVTVTANITGSATTTLTTTINTGTLGAGDTLVVNLPTFNFPAGVYTVTTTSSNPDDSEPGNDANTTLMVVNGTPVVSTFTPATPAVCAGKSVLISTQFTTPAPAPVNHPAVSSGPLNTPIPDADADGISSILAVAGIPATAQVTGISVTINAAHTWNSDMIFNLKAPNGQIINLVNAKGGNGDGYTDAIISSAGTTTLPAANTTPVTGTFAADGSLNVGPTDFKSNTANFASLFTVANGAWTLSVNDNAFFDTGELISWSISITYGTPHPAINWTPVTGLYTDAAATVPYVAGTNAYSIYAKPTGTTTYTATSTSSFGCTSSSTVTVTVNANPVVSLGTLPTRICLSDTLVPLSGSPVGGVWSGVGVSGNFLVPPATAVGTYNLSYTYTDNLGCSTTSTIPAKIEPCPERVRLLRDDAVILFPNPNKGQFNIRINSTLYNKLTMRVYTSSGMLARTQQFSGLSYGRVIPIDLTALPGGSYMVQFYYTGGPRTADKTFIVLVGR